MAVSRQIIIQSRDTSNNTVQTTISNINPSETITNQQLRTAAVTLNELTTNTFVNAYVVNTTLLEAE